MRQLGLQALPPFRSRPGLGVLARGTLQGDQYALFPSQCPVAAGRGGRATSFGKGAPTFSRPFSEACLRGGQITANFPSPLLAVGEGTLSRGCPSSGQLEDGRTP